MKKKKRRTAGRAQTGFSKRHVDAAIAARDRARAGTTKEVAIALLADGSEFQPVTLATVLVLEKIKSPFIIGTTIAAPILEITRALYVLSNPIDDVDKIVARSMADEKHPLSIFDAQVHLFARNIPLDRLKDLGAKIDAHISRAMSTAIPHGESPPHLTEARPPAKEAAPGSVGN